MIKLMKKNLPFQGLVYRTGLISSLVFTVALFLTPTKVQAQDFTNAFITTWEVTAGDLDLRIPTRGGGYNYSIDWGDGTVENNIMGDATHIYAAAGTYEVKIIGDFPAIYFGFSFDGYEDQAKIQTIKQWGNIEWRTMYGAFIDATNLTYEAIDAPDLSNVISIGYMFSGASSFNGDIGNWNTEMVIFMRNVFAGASAFNQDIGGWNTSNVTDMGTMFVGASAFNQDIGDWETGKVTNMNAMFSQASSFNGDIGDWDTKNVLTMNSMFSGVSAFNQDIGNWNTGNVTNMLNMFSGASSFNQDIGGWDTKNVTTMLGMFGIASAFDQDIGGWDIRNVTNMTSMLRLSGLSKENYDKTLVGWAAQDVQENVPLGALGLEYCLGEDARQSLIDDHKWIIINDTKNCPILPNIQLTDANNTIINNGNSPSQSTNTIFGTVELNQTSSETYTITNTGTAALIISSITSDDGQFTITGFTPNTSIAPNGSTSTFNVEFTPTSAGAQSATITINSNDADEGTYTFGVSGTGGAPNIQVDDATVGTDFGIITIAQTGSQTYTITNTGTATLEVSSISSNDGQFTITGFTPNTSIVPNGGTSTFNVEFTPTSTGAQSATITINSNDGDEGNLYLYRHGRRDRRGRVTTGQSSKAIRSSPPAFSLKWSGDSKRVFLSSR